MPKEEREEARVRAQGSAAGHRPRPTSYYQNGLARFGSRINITPEIFQSEIGIFEAS